MSIFLINAWVPFNLQKLTDSGKFYSKKQFDNLVKLLTDFQLSLKHNTVLVML